MSIVFLNQKISVWISAPHRVGIHIRVVFGKIVLRGICLGVSTAIVSVSAHAQAVHIFSSTDSDGTTRWATQAIDGSYMKVPSLSTTISDLPARLNANDKPIKCGLVIAKRRQEFQALIHSSAQKHGVDSSWITGLVKIESGFIPNAVSAKGAIGLMQLMPATAAKYGVRDSRELFDPSRNLDIGVQHLKHLLAMHNGNVALAMASYNAGAGAVAKYGRRIPRFNETMLYVPAVLAAASRHSQTVNP